MQRRLASPTFLFLVSFILALVTAVAAQNVPTVSITDGTIRGVALPAGGANFLGIPYAQPPVGGLRWHEPVPLKPWSGVREAKEFGAPCAQSIFGDWNRRTAEESKEDCLYLNVMTPEWPPKKPLPVMFWIREAAVFRCREVNTQLC